MNRSNTGGPGVNLMPLLDVLLCTMGTLIIILGIINREARLHPAKRLPGTPVPAGGASAELVDARDDLQYRIQQLTKSRAQTLTDLNQNRARLADVEASARQLEDRLRNLSDADKQLQQKSAGGQNQQLRSELIQLSTQRMQLDSDLKKARYQAANRQPVYAVVPFEGMYKTNRRPIYIECRGDAVILQPEGIVFTPTDFLGPGGPGNPLASALLAAEQYWRDAPRPSPNMPNEPYPLLLVRPDGIIAYYLVRDAMNSWDAEFGYELVGQDWQLDFPMQPEPQLREMETRAVADARKRMEWLAQADPDAFSRKPTKVQYHVSPFRGGAVRDGGPSLGNDPFADDPLGGFGRKSSSAGTTPGGTGNGLGPDGLGNGGPANNAIGNGNAGNGMSGGMASGSAAGNGSFSSGGGPGGMADSRVGGGRGNSAFNVGPGGTGTGATSAGGIGAGGDNMALGGSGAAQGNGVGDSDGPTLGGALQATGSGTGQQSFAGGADIAQVGPRYAGAPGGAGTFAGSYPGSANGVNGNGKSGMGGAAGGGTGNPSIGSTSGQGGSRELKPNEYGYAALPGAASGAAASTDNSQSGSGMSGSADRSKAAGQTGNTSQMSSSSAYASSMSSSSNNGMASSGGMSSSGGSDSPSGGGGFAQSPSSADPNQTGAGIPSLSFDMTPQQRQQQYADAPPQSSQSPQSSPPSRSHTTMHYRGKDWALPNMHNASLPVERPIRVECFNDRLVLLPDTRDQQAQVIPLGERTDDAVDELVAAVRGYTKTWGMAGRGMYWKPQLVLNVNPSAESRAADLQALLADSGWNVKRR